MAQSNLVARPRRRGRPPKGLTPTGPPSIEQQWRPVLDLASAVQAGSDEVELDEAREVLAGRFGPLDAAAVLVALRYCVEIVDIPAPVGPGEWL